MSLILLALHVLLSYFLLAYSISLVPIRTPILSQGEPPTTVNHFVFPGDTWSALAWRYGTNEETIRTANYHINRQREPAIGSEVLIPDPQPEQRVGQLLNRNDGGLLQLSAIHHVSDWYLAILNDQDHPRRPLLYRDLFIPDGLEPLKQLPVGVQSLELSHLPAQPGQAMAIRGELDDDYSPRSWLAQVPVNIFVRDNSFVGLLGTGAFFGPGDHELTFFSENQPLWSQPWRMTAGDWFFEDITLTGEAAAIDAESIRVERERLMSIWSQSTDQLQWSSSFRQPIDQYLDISSTYGARRSYNGGPYRSYHEGVDFSAYAGTPVFSPAGGTIVVAERLYVRGGAVIIDHGLGIYSGVYHLSEVLVQPGQVVKKGEMIGKVGTTGLSTGNHLHWDMLVSGTWIDASGWLETDLGCWILEGWGTPCSEE